MGDNLSHTDKSEFGAPHASQQDFQMIKSISPVDNVKKANFPNMLFLVGVADKNVPYFHSLKMANKVREHRTNDSKIACFIDFYGTHNISSAENDMTFTTYQLAFIHKMMNEKK